MTRARRLVVVLAFVIAYALMLWVHWLPVIFVLTVLAVAYAGWTNRRARGPDERRGER